MKYFKYTPALLEPKTLEDTLIGRDIELDNLKRILKSASSRESFSHAILIGPKGIGKTHILQILYRAVRGEIKTKGLNAFKDKYIPVIFPEEEYLSDITKFLLLTLRYLAESKHPGIPKITDEIISPDRLDLRQKEAALNYLKEFRKKTGKILLILVDNISDIIERLSDEDQSALREVLMTYDSILLIGSAPTLFDSIVNHDRPLYNFFEIVWLKDLSFEDSTALLNRYAELEGRKDLMEKFIETEPKLRAIHELAGGNPRLILSLYHIIVEGDIASIEKTFLKILDDLNPYFRERMKDLSAQQSEIVDVIARGEKLLTPTEISARCYMPVNVVNSQLKRLERMGYVRKNAEKPKRVLYDLTEKLFRLWRQMRVEAGRKRLRFIVRFLEIWYTKKELLEDLRKTFSVMVTSILSGDSDKVRAYSDRFWYLKEAIPELKQDIGIDLILKSLTGDDETVIEICKKNLQQDPNNPTLWVQLGASYVGQKKYEESINAFRKALELEPDDFASWVCLGLTYELLNRYEEAASAYKKSIDLMPTFPYLWLQHGNVLINLNKYYEAVESYKKAVNIKPDLIKGWRGLIGAYVAIFVQELTNGNINSAMEKFRESLNCLLNIPKDDKVFDFPVNLFKLFVKNKQTDLLKRALKEVEAANLPELFELLSPFSTLVKYLETKDRDIIDRLRHEERIIIDEMLKMLESKPEEKSIKKKSNGRKKRI